MLAWDWAHAERVLSAWGAWCGEAPESVTSMARLFQAPDVPWLPADVRGRSLVIVDAVVLEDSERAGALLAPLRALRPEIDTFADVPAASVARLQLDPEAPTAVYANSVLVSDLPERAVEALVAAAGPGSGSELLFVEIRQLGGALSRPGDRAGALDRMDGAFLVLGVGLDTGAGWAAVREDAHRVMGVVGAVDEPGGVPPDGRRARSTRAGAGRRCPGSAWRRCGSRPTRTGCSCRRTVGPSTE